MYQLREIQFNNFDKSNNFQQEDLMTDSQGKTTLGLRFDKNTAIQKANYRLSQKSS